VRGGWHGSKMVAKGGVVVGRGVARGAAFAIGRREARRKPEGEAECMYSSARQVHVPVKCMCTSCMCTSFLLLG
jgi:hypothetical protein